MCEPVFPRPPALDPYPYGTVAYRASAVARRHLARSLHAGTAFRHDSPSPRATPKQETPRAH